MRIRVSDSDQTMALLSALDADPVQGLLALDVRQDLTAGTLDGVEMAPTYLGRNGYNLDAPYLTSFALIPKFEVLAASSSAWGDLSDDDRQALADAGDETVDWEAERLAGDEASELGVLCSNGLVVVEPSASALAAWRRAAPTIQGAEARRDMADIATTLAGAKPGDARLRPARRVSRRDLGGPGAPAARGRPGGPAVDRPVDGPTIPPGTYVETVTAEQFAAAGQSGPDWSADVTYTWVLRPDGTFLETQEPDYPDQGPLAWEVRGRR